MGVTGGALCVLISVSLLPFVHCTCPTVCAAGHAGASDGSCPSCTAPVNFYCPQCCASGCDASNCCSYTTAAGVACPVGYTCAGAANNKAACGAGKACNGGVSANCACSGGYYSPSTTSGACSGTTGSCQQCGTGNSCAGNSAQQVACTCSAGYASSSPTSAGCVTTQGSCSACAAGFTCPGGSGQAAACSCAGGYASTAATSSAACSGTTGTCGVCGAGNWCAGGSAQPAPCTCNGGYFSSATTATACAGTAAPCTVAGSGKSAAGGGAPAVPCTCSTGYASSSVTSTACLGSSGTCVPAGAGNYSTGGAAQSAACTCNAGHASVSPTSNGCVGTTGSCAVCGAGYACPAGGRAQPQPCTCVPGRSSSSTTSMGCAGTGGSCSVTGCNVPGAVCAGGTAQLATCSCSAGYFSNSTTTPLCSGTSGSCMMCGAGRSCGGLGTQPQACSCTPGYASTSSVAASCAGTSGSCALCGAGSWCTGGAAQPRACSCAPGYASTANSSTSCAAKAASCFPCGSGMFCTGGTAQPQACTCAVGWASVIVNATACDGTGGSCTAPGCSVAGNYCAGGANSVLPCTCDAGWCSTSVNTGACAGTGGTCAMAPAGRYCTGGSAQPQLCTCAPGYVSEITTSFACAGRNGTCVQCGPGRSCEGGAAGRVVCACRPGWASTARNSTRCSGTNGTCFQCGVGLGCAGLGEPPVRCSCDVGYASTRNSSALCAGVSGTCLPCGAGRACAGSDSLPSDCTCSAGYASVAVTSGSCDATAASCLPAGAGFFAVGGSSLPSPCTCFPLYASLNTTSDFCSGSDGTCESAPCRVAGVACAGGSNLVALCTCDPGYASNSSNSTACVGTTGTCRVAGVGRAAAGGRAPAVLCTCDPGFASTSPASAACDGQTGTCAPCSTAGIYCSGGTSQPLNCTCAPGYSSIVTLSSSCTGNASSCAPAGPGKASLGGRAQPTTCACRPGYASASATSTACTGSSGTCVAAGAGYFAIGGGAQSAVCTCDAGFGSSSTTSVLCAGTGGTCGPAGAGNFATGGGSQVAPCTCDSGYTSSSTTSASCSASSGSCVPCGVGQACLGAAAQRRNCTCSGGYASTATTSNSCAGTAASCIICVAGTQCQGGSTVPRSCTCSPGYASTAPGSTSCANTASTCAVCGAGNVCLGGGSQVAPCSCAGGWASISLVSSACSAQSPSCSQCGAGYACTGNRGQPQTCTCLAGYSSVSLTSTSCTGLSGTCVPAGPGHWSVGNSSSPRPCTCTAGYASTVDASSSCSGTTSSCSVCGAGNWCTGGANQPAGCTCLAGMSSTLRTSTACSGAGGSCTLCGVGMYCLGGAFQPALCTCLAGYASASLNSSACSASNGTCVAAPRGYAALGGATQAAPCTCSPGTASTVIASDACSGNSGSCVACAAGQYCGGLDKQPGLCLPGHYCPARSTVADQFVCPAGRYGATAGLPNSNCSGLCAPGSYCPPGSLAAIPCPAGTFGDTYGIPNCTNVCPPGNFCPTGTAVTGGYPCPAGRFGNSTALSDAQCTGQCWPGTFCVAGSIFPVLCPAGKFGAHVGEWISSCSGDCTAGYYCPPGSVVSTALPCNGSSVYCPPSSGQPVVVPDGWYSFPVGGDRATTAVACTPGTTCAGGVQSLCPGGYYGLLSQESNPTCSGQCIAGYYCPPGSASPQPVPCGNFSVYCPTGAVSPLPVSGGYYSIGGTQTPTDQLPCYPGTYCVHGLQFQCPRGFYGASRMLTTATCTGTCFPGYMCSEGSTKPNAALCPQGFFCTKGLALPCPPGTYNDALGGSNPNNCTRCPAMTYGTRWNATSISHCLPCKSPEGSRAGATACWPGIVSIEAFNPAPVVPLVSVGDEVIITFSKSTNGPPVDTQQEINSLLNFSVSLGELSAFWDSQRRVLTVRITQLDITDALRLATQIGLITVGINSSVVLTDSLGQSQPAAYPRMLLTGSWGVPKVPQFVDPGGAVAASYARDTGHNYGLGVGDSLVLRFDNPCRLLDVSTKDAIDAVFTFSAPLGANYTGQWLRAGSFQNAAVVITMTRDPADPVASQLAAVGLLSVAVKSSANLVSYYDSKSGASNSSTVITLGTWGDVPAVTVKLRSPVSARVVVAPPATFLPGWTLLHYYVEWAGNLQFDGASHRLFDVAGSGSTAVAYTMTGLQTGSPTYVRTYARLSIVEAKETLTPPNYTTPIFVIPEPIITRMPELTGVAIQGSMLLMDARGGQTAVLTGSNLGLDEPVSMVSATYSNAYDIKVASCRVNTDGVEVHCTTVAGVGHSYRWTVLLDGVSYGNTSTAPGSSVMNYSLPVIQNVVLMPNSTPPVYRISGHDFGPLGTPVDSAWLSLPADPQATFYSDNCTVVYPDIEIVCEQPVGAGANLVWTLVIGDQQSAAPTVTYPPPRIRSISCSPSPCDQLQTLGADTITIYGSGFGPVTALVNYIEGTLGAVTMMSAAQQIPLISCAVITAGTAIACQSPPGFGLRYYMTVAAVLQSSLPYGQPLSYGVPAIAMVVVNGKPSGNLSLDANNIFIAGQYFGGPALLEFSLTSVGTNTSWTAAGPFDVTKTQDRLTFNVPRLRSDFIGYPWIYVRVVINKLGSNVVLLPVAAPTLAPLDPVILQAAVPRFCSLADKNWLVVSGNSFGFSAQNTTVNILQAGVSVPVRVCSVINTEIAIGTNVTSGDLSVVVGNMASESYFFSVDTLGADPKVTSVLVNKSPSGKMAAAGGDTVQVYGSAFHRSYFIFLVPQRLASMNVSQLAVSDLIPTVVDGVSMTPTYAECTIPAGIDDHLRLVIFGRGKIYATAFFVSYSPPVVTAIASADGVVPLANSGGSVYVLGKNFGYWSENVSVTIDTRPCTPLTVVNDSAIFCRAPPGASANPLVVVSVASQTQGSSNTGLAYASPVVTSVYPNTSSTEGNIPSTVFGYNFGRREWNLGAPRVFFLLPAPLLPAQAAVHDFTDTYAQVTVPPGVGWPSNGTSVGVAVFLGSQNGTLASCFAYDPPVIADVDALGKCPITGCDVLIRGTGFGGMLVIPVVAVNGVPCVVALETRTHRSVVCRAPPGVGANNQVTITVLERTASNNRSFAYDPPSIAYTIPTVASQVGASELIIIGSNFDARGLTILISGVPCANPQLLNSSAVRCGAARYRFIGRSPISVVVAQQSSNVVDVHSVCLHGYYGVEVDVVCQLCPPNAICGGGTFDPVPAAGYWKLGRTSFTACIPLEACVEMVPGANGTNCAAQYSGVECKLCAKRFYRSGDVCIPCPDNAYILLILFVLLVIASGALASWMHRKMFNLKGLTIGLDLLQTLSMFGGFNFAWPPTLKTVFTTASIATFSPELTSPECTISFTYAQKWVFFELSPVMIAVMLLVGVLVSTYTNNRRSEKQRMKDAAESGGVLNPEDKRGLRQLLSEAGDVGVGGVFTLLYYTYFSTLRRGLEIFACTENSEGVSYLDADPSYRCFTGTHAKLVSAAICALVGYGIGIPAAIAFVMWKFRKEIRADQQLWLVGRGNVAADNPQWRVRKRFAKLYQDYREDFHYWRLVLIARKGCLVVIAVLCKKNPMFQASLALSILAVAYGLQAKFQAFVSPAVQDKAFTKYHAELEEKLRRDGALGGEFPNGVERHADASVTTITIRDETGGEGDSRAFTRRQHESKGRFEMAPPITEEAGSTVSQAAVVDAAQQPLAESDGEVMVATGAAAVAAPARRSSRRTSASFRRVSEQMVLRARRMSHLAGEARRNSARRLSTVTVIATAQVEAMLDFNVLETALLCSSTSVLLSGMVFQSAAIPANSVGYILMIVFVLAVVICSVSLFAWMLATETKRSCVQRKKYKLEQQVHDQTEKARKARAEGSTLNMVLNPLAEQLKLKARRATRVIVDSAQAGWAGLARGVSMPRFRNPAAGSAGGRSRRRGAAFETVDAVPVTRGRSLTATNWRDRSTAVISSLAQSVGNIHFNFQGSGGSPEAVTVVNRLSRSRTEDVRPPADLARSSGQTLLSRVNAMRGRSATTTQSPASGGGGGGDGGGDAVHVESPLHAPSVRGTAPAPVFIRRSASSTDLRKPDVADGGGAEFLSPIQLRGPLVAEGAATEETKSQL